MRRERPDRAGDPGSEGRGGLRPEQEGELTLLRELIRTFFADYLRLVEPDMAAGLRLDQIAFPQALIEAGCLVAEVPGRNGAEVVTVLVRIEPELLPHEELSARIGRSLKALQVCYGEPVLVSVILLQGGRSGVRLESGVIARCAGMELARIYFSTFALSESRAEHYLERPEPLSWALAARMRPMQRTPDDHRRACLERIAAADLDGEARVLLRRWAEGPGGAARALHPATGPVVGS